QRTLRRGDSERQAVGAGRFVSGCARRDRLGARQCGARIRAALITIAGAWAAALEQHLAGPEGDRRAPAVPRVAPLAPVELGPDDDARALLQVLGTRPRLCAVDLDGEVVRLIHPLLAVAAARARSDSQAGDLDAGRQLAHLNAAGQVAGQSGGGDVAH